MRYRRLTFLLIWLLALVPTATVFADTPGITCSLLAPVDWREARTQAYAIIYPADNGGLGQSLADAYGADLDAEYSRFEALFGVSLNLPISIRIYPSEDHYQCLNAQAPEILPGSTHTHIGDREIALLGENIDFNDSAWQRNIMNVLRYEQASLFVEAVTGGKAPAGLQAAIGYFAQDPADTIAPLNLPRTGWQTPNHDWRDLWESPKTPQDFRRGLEATSTVAYLVDVNGWDKFLNFLRDLKTSENFHQSLVKTYKVELSALQEQWRSYFPLYFNGRYRFHAIYNYDLSPQQKLLEAGAYADAEKALNDTVGFLEKTQQQDKLKQARGMLTQARLGQEAGILIAQSRQALQSGDYQRSLDLVDQAQGSYAQLGNVHRLDELSAYRDQVQKILDLHTELSGLQAQVEQRKNPFLLSARVFYLGQRLAALGDVQGLSRVEEIASEVEARQRGQHSLLSLAGVIVVLALLVVRVGLLRRKPLPEAHL